MNKNLVLKCKEALSSVLPITVIVFILFFTIAPVSKGMMAIQILGFVYMIKTRKAEQKDPTVPEFPFRSCGVFFMIYNSATNISRARV